MTRVYRYRHVVTFDETNVVGNVYFAHYLHWQGHCREHFLADMVPDVLKSVRAGDLALATVACAMDYYEECFALDEIEVAMSLRECRGSRITMAFDFRRAEQLVARGTQTVACLRRTPTGTEPVDVPSSLVKALENYR
ncbi:acyl-CoA thioesterase [Haloechinothrix salitolerans]|uniref:Acyl-CoA thioesterase n=1 Tax=Haloechinothrix salitolerans TaxID=926830 RepID=A0ABW2BUS4_9PSEU